MMVQCDPTLAGRSMFWFAFSVRKATAGDYTTAPPWRGVVFVTYMGMLLSRLNKSITETLECIVSFSVGRYVPP